ncbi:uncharacterized protein LOC131638732 [Vicia villosa]|uniref:uncharacterized protein LOC131638732 n=1 Tax=Vicia villosa TaxID=3911 RepID=UPI00273B3BB5|nr:uncharacterized protein LOC131638732 [Vicia villosa]
MGYRVSVKSIELNGFEIKTTVTTKKEDIDSHISSFLHSSDDYGTKVIGFDVEWCLADPTDDEPNLFSRCATLQLCDGNSCLVMRFEFHHQVPNSLLNFMRMPNYTFVSYGVKDNLAELEKHLGIGCKNAVELGPLAASLLKVPRLSYCGVDELAFLLCKLDLRKYRPASLDFDWRRIGYGKSEEVQLAVVNVYSYHKIGSALLGSNNILIGQQPHFGLF